MGALISYQLSAIGFQLPPAQGVPGHLPRPRTAFVGSARELAGCERLLESTQLLTVTGIGGCGKTRMAL